MVWMLLSILGLLILLVVGLFIAASFQAQEFKVERSTTTTASASDIYEVISDLRRFAEWSPWQKHDPAMKIVHTGPATGVGSSQSWDGNNKVGSGRMTIVDASPTRGVDLDLEFFRPWKSRSNGKWAIHDEGGHRRITWSMSGKNAVLMARVFCMFMNMDKMIGRDFETGLANLKALVEGPALERAA